MKDPVSSNPSNTSWCGPSKGAGVISVSAAVVSRGPFDVPVEEKDKKPGVEGTFNGRTDDLKAHASTVIDGMAIAARNCLETG